MNAALADIGRYLGWQIFKRALHEPGQLLDRVFKRLSNVLRTQDDALGLALAQVAAANVDLGKPAVDEMRGGAGFAGSSLCSRVCAQASAWPSDRRRAPCAHRGDADGDDRGLVDEHTTADDMHECVRGSQIDRDIIGKDARYA
jgi:hypothetical protein